MENYYQDLACPRGIKNWEKAKDYGVSAVTIEIVTIMEHLQHI